MTWLKLKVEFYNCGKGLVYLKHSDSHGVYN